MRALIALLQPDVLVKGADWPAHAIPGRDTVESRGGRVVRAPLEAGEFVVELPLLLQRLLPAPFQFARH